MLFIKKVWEKNFLLNNSLGLCSLLSIATLNVVHGISLGVIITFILIFTEISVSLLKNILPNTIRLPIYIMIIMIAILILEILMNIFFINLYRYLEIFISMCVTNCMVLNRAEIYASKNNLVNSAFDGLSLGIGLIILLCILGMIRELFSNGTLFNNIDIFSETLSELIYIKIHNYSFIFFILPSGALIILGFILALKNFLDNKILNFFKKN
uniref:Electron transport complex subunit E n=1 Tax=Candidatus Aschnera chinzeii TaxID=1485666 RepID=A0AAT9G4R0_9ENTR|nr:MAG: electron transport complex subunit E [Candidatus Aschnera chinzeii]